MTDLTYASYLHVDELLALQQPQSDGPEHDEMVFIVTQQVYELWFKQLLHEIDFVNVSLLKHDTARVLHTLKRILTILKTMNSQVDILETMTPLEFNSFRGTLDTASGFQSAQFRELEFALGYKRAAMLNQHADQPAVHARLVKRLTQPGLWDTFLHYVDSSGFPLPADLLNRDVTTPCPPSPDVQQALLRAYKTDLMLTEIAERLVDLDEGLQEWRYRHIKMTERTIGMKNGTGGSSGIDYLRATLFRPLFPDLWILRTLL